MARDHTRIYLDIWGDDDWLDLSPQAQHLYFVLTTWPPSLCGAGDWQPRKIAARAKGWTVPNVLDAAEELVAGEFTLIDIDTEEYLQRSWIKHDGLYRVQNMAVSIANARAALASRQLRGVVVHEVLKLRKSEPTLESWKKDAVRKMLEQNAVDPRDIDWPNPWASSSVSGWVRGKASPKPTGEASPSGSSRATPTPAPTPNSHSSKDDDAALEPPDDPYAEVVVVPQYVDSPSRPQTATPTSAAKTVVRQVLGSAYPKTMVDRLANQVSKLFKEGHPDALIREALTEWERRPDCGKPEFLPTVLGDLVKAQRAGPDTRNVHKLRGLAQLEAEQRAAEESQTPARKELA